MDNNKGLVEMLDWLIEGRKQCATILCDGEHEEMLKVSLQIIDKSIEQARSIIIKYKGDNSLCFSKRRKIQDEFYKWAEENGATTEPINVIAYLKIKDLLS